MKTKTNTKQKEAETNTVRSEAPATSKKTREASAAELRRAAETLRQLGDIPGSERLLAQAASMAPARTAKPKAEPRPQCSGTKKDGAKCTARAKEGHNTCVDHTPAWDRLDAAEQGAFTSWFKQQDVGNIANLIGWCWAKLIVCKVRAEQKHGDQ